MWGVFYMKKVIALILCALMLSSSGLAGSAATVSTEFAGAEVNIPLEENTEASAAIGEK
jgi:hypothetical protein